MLGVINSTGKGVVIDSSSPTLKLGKQACPDLGRDLELYWTSSLLLNDRKRSADGVRLEVPWHKRLDIGCRPALNNAGQGLR